jgi:hypothetical protein
MVEPPGAEGVESATTASIEGQTVPRQTDGGVGVAGLDRVVEVEEAGVGTTAGFKELLLLQLIRILRHFKGVGSTNDLSL